ncbi:uncharacterized protein LOC142358399, partial [Convolutriloba macropyga]|uniref:uncharacterized protein LOC142358399 n=1 Tax=Convolutriloba macropyga TaxID=536237 RepID=UPI003F51C94C
GYNSPSLNGIQHADIDECSHSVCGANSEKCNNSVGGYLCECKEGYQFSGSVYGIGCEDFDECKYGSPHCGVNGSCINVLGTYSCRCNSGYQPFRNQSGSYCRDLDECAIGRCGEGACTNYMGSYDCVCENGFYFDRTTYPSCQPWYKKWDELLFYYSHSTGSLGHIFQWSQLPPGINRGFVHPLLHDKLTSANQIAVVFFDNNKNSLVEMIFRGDHHVYNWFSSDNLMR